MKVSVTSNARNTIKSYESAMDIMQVELINQTDGESSLNWLQSESNLLKSYRLKKVVQLLEGGKEI